MKILATALIVAGAVVSTNALAADPETCNAVATAYANSVVNPGGATALGVGVGGTAGLLTANALGGPGNGRLLIGTFVGGTVGGLIGNGVAKEKWQNAHEAKYLECMAGP